MTIRPSAAIRQNYNEIAELCRRTAEPIFLTNRREKMLKLREELLEVQEDRIRGSKGYSVDQVAQMMRDAIQEAATDGTVR